MLHRGLLTAPTSPDVEPAAPDWPRHMRSLAAQARDERLKVFYGAGAPAADTPLSALPMVALDIETTGLDPSRDEIVSIAVVPMTLAQINAGQTRHWIVKPRGELAAESVALHGITHSQIAAAPDLDAVLQPLLASLAGRVVVVHCRDIERGFFDAALRARIREGLQFPVIDTMELEARLHRQPARRWAGVWGLGRRRPAPSIRLADSRSRYALPPYRPHHAPTDALASAELLLAQVADRFSAQTPVGDLWR